MQLNDLSPELTVTQLEKIYKNQFSETLKVSDLGLNESKKMLAKTQQLIHEFKHTSNSSDVYKRESNPAYIKLKLIEETINKQIESLSESTIKETGSKTMTNSYVKALKAVASGKQLPESVIKKLNVSRGLQKMLESQKLALGFIQKIVEQKRTNTVPIMEGEIDEAQTVLAAQDIADQIQSIIEKFADIKYKELPALYNSIRNTQGVQEAEQFNISVTQSLDTLTDALETAKADVNQAVSELTGESVGTNDLDIDSLENDKVETDTEDESDIDLGDDFDLDFEEEPEEDEELTNVGRERR